MSTKDRSLDLSVLGSDKPDPPLHLREELQNQLLDSLFTIVMDNGSQCILWAIGSYHAGYIRRGSHSAVREAARVSPKLDRWCGNHEVDATDHHRGDVWKKETPMGSDKAVIGKHSISSQAQASGKSHVTAT